MFSMEFNTSQKTSALMGQKFCCLWKPVPHKPLENGTTEIIVSCTNTHWNTHIFTIPLFLWHRRFLCTETSITASFFGCILTLLTTNSTLQPFRNLKSQRCCFPLCAVTGMRGWKTKAPNPALHFHWAWASLNVRRDESLPGSRVWTEHSRDDWLWFKSFDCRHAEIWARCHHSHLSNPGTKLLLVRQWANQN